MTNPHGLFRIAAGLVVLLIAAVCAAGQISTRPQTEAGQDDKTAKGSIRGRIVCTDGSFVSENVKLTLQTFRENITTTFTDNQGQFEFPNIAAGNYKLEVEADRQKFEVFTENVQVFRGTPTVVNLTLREKNTSATSSRGTVVSISELERNIPSNARKEFEKGTQAANARKVDEAINHLRKAISIYPDYVSAYNDLGTYLLAQGKLEEAATALRDAIRRDDKAFNPRLNLGIVLVYQKRFSEASDLLAKAEALEPTSPSVHLYSGLAAAGLSRFEAAEKELKAAYSLGESKYAIALFHLGQLYLTNADRNQALKCFERYLAEVPTATNADQVRAMVARLRQ